MFSRTTEYALRAMATMSARPDEYVSAPALSKQIHVPVNYLAKVLQQLSSARLICGRRGVGGGYRVARPPEEIRLLDVINAMMPIKRLTAGPGTPTDDGAPLYRKLDLVLARVMETLAEVTLADLSGGGLPGAVCQGVPARVPAGRP